MKTRLQSGSPSPQEPHSDLHVTDESPYLLTAEAARFLKFDRKHDGSMRSLPSAMRLFREWAARNRVPQARRGRTLLYDKRVLAAFLEQRDWTKRHAEQSGPALVRRQW